MKKIKKSLALGLVGLLSLGSTLNLSSNTSNENITYFIPEEIFISENLSEEEIRKYRNVLSQAYSQAKENWDTFDSHISQIRGFGIGEKSVTQGMFGNTRALGKTYFAPKDHPSRDNYFLKPGFIVEIYSPDGGVMVHEIGGHVAFRKMPYRKRLKLIEEWNSIGTKYGDYRNKREDLIREGLVSVLAGSNLEEDIAETNRYVYSLKVGINSELNTNILELHHPNNSKIRRRLWLLHEYGFISQEEFNLALSKTG